MPGGSTFTITPVAIADPLLLISIFNGLTMPGFALTILDKLDSNSTPWLLVSEEDDVITAALFRITFPLNRNGLSALRADTRGGCHDSSSTQNNPAA